MPRFNRTPIYQCVLVREGSVQTPPLADCERRAAAVASEYLKDAPNEQLLTIMLDAKCRVIGIVPITSGLVDCSLVHPREVIRPAIIHNASGIIMVHNHPSGDLTPSDSDYRAANRIKDACKIVSIDLYAAMIVNHTGEYISI